MGFRAAEWRCQAQKTAPELQLGPPAVEAKKLQAMLMLHFVGYAKVSRTLMIAELANYFPAVEAKKPQAMQKFHFVGYTKVFPDTRDFYLLIVKGQTLQSEKSDLRSFYLYVYFPYI